MTRLWTLEMAEANNLKRAQERLRKELGVRTVNFDPLTPLKPKVSPYRDTNAYCLADQIEKAGYPRPVLEHQFSKEINRKHRADLSYPKVKFAIEIDGMVHRIKERHLADMEKNQLYLKLGWRVLHVTPKQSRNGEALELAKPYLKEIHG